MRWSLLLTLLLAVPALAQSPCDGRITDKLDHPMNAGAISKPAPGECYTDPAFGTKICRVGTALPAEGSFAIVKTNYNALRAWNADGSRLFLWHRSGSGRTYELYEGDEPYTHIQTLELTGSATTGSPYDIEHLIWDPFDPNVLYYPSGYRYSVQPAPRLYKVTLDPLGGPPAQEIVRSFETAPTNCPLEHGLSIGHGHDMALSADRLIGFSCGSTVNRIQFLYSITNDQVLAVQPSTQPELDRVPIPLQSGAGVYFDYAKELRDNSFNLVNTLTLGVAAEHQTLGLAGGRDYLNRVNFDEPPGSGTLVSIDLLTDVATVHVGPSSGWPYPKSSTHPSLTTADGSGWIAVGGVGASTGATLLDNEIILANVGTGEVCRIAHARTMSRNGSWGYWAETHPQISEDGYRVLFTSDFLGSNTVDAYVVDLRSDGPPPPPDAYRAILTWTDNSDDEDGFHVERALVVAGPFSRIATVGADVTTYTDEPIVEGATWCWRLVAFNDGGETPGPAACATASAPIDPPLAPGVPQLVVELQP